MARNRKKMQDIPAPPSVEDDLEAEMEAMNMGSIGSEYGREPEEQEETSIPDPEENLDDAFEDEGEPEPVQEEAPEPEEDPEPEPEEDPEPLVAEADDEDLKDDPPIPKGRLNKLLAQRDAMKKEIEQLRQSVKGEIDSEEVDFSTNFTQLKDMILDNDAENGAKIFNEVLNKAVQLGSKRGAEFALSQFQLQAAARDQKRDFDSVAADLEATYEVFNGQSEAYDADFTSRVLAVQRGYQATGDDPATALEKAAADMIKIHRPDLLPQAPAPKATPRDQVKQAQQAKSIERTVKSANAQPPKLGSRRDASQRDSQDSRVVKLANMDEDQFDAIPKNELDKILWDSM